jgi:hypothetical protein
MSRWNVIVKAIGVLALVWAVVWGIRELADSRQITADRVQREIEKADFSDWSDRVTVPENSEAKHRAKEIERISDLINRLDFHEREKNRHSRASEDFFRKLSAQEKTRFIDLTVMESMNRFMEALDAMPPEQRRKFVEQGLREVEEGRTEADLARAEALGADLLERISQEGMRAYFEKSSAETKLDLAPLMEAVNETMQGLRGNELRPHAQF